MTGKDKKLYTGVQLVAVGPGCRKERLLVVSPKGGVPSYGPDELKAALRDLRDFVAFDLAAEISEAAGVCASELSAKLMCLDYLVRGVEFKEVEVLI